jgi:O-antigen biosynthesis protein
VIGPIARVVRGEGLASALRRASERTAEALREAALRLRGTFVRSDGRLKTSILNVLATRVSARLGGVPVQLAARLRAERALRPVALLHPGGLEMSSPILHSRLVPGDFASAAGFAAALRDALAVTGARAIHLEGLDGVPLASVLALAGSGVRVVASVHDFSLFCARPHLLELPAARFCGYSRDSERCARCLRQGGAATEGENAERRAQGGRLLAAAAGLIFPSLFLLERHRELFSLPDLAGEVVEPGAPGTDREVRSSPSRSSLAFAGGVKRHKGAHLLPEVIRRSGGGALWHVYGGGDEDLLRELRRMPTVTVHGYYHAGELPGLLARDRIGMVVVPSIVPESYGLVISEAWRAGAAVAAFDIGAPAERIRRDGGGVLAPLESGAAGLADIVLRWRSGAIVTAPPLSVPSAADAARAMMELYAGWGLLGRDP